MDRPPVEHLVCRMGVTAAASPSFVPGDKRTPHLEEDVE